MSACGHLVERLAGRKAEQARQRALQVDRQLRAAALGHLRQCPRGQECDGCSRRIADIQTPLGVRRLGAAKPGPGRPRRFAEAVGFADCPAVLAPMASSPTHCANCVRSVQTVATKSEVVARCARWPWALRFSASHRRPAVDPPAAWASARGVRREHHRGPDLASGGTWQGRFLRRRGAQRRGRRAQRAS